MASLGQDFQDDLNIFLGPLRWLDALSTSTALILLLLIIRAWPW